MQELEQVIIQMIRDLEIYAKKPNPNMNYIAKQEQLISDLTSAKIAILDKEQKLEDDLLLARRSNVNYQLIIKLLEVDYKQLVKADLNDRFK